MKPIERVDYYDLDETNPDAVECRVTYADGAQQVFYREEDLLRVQHELQRQAKSADSLRP